MDIQNLKNITRYTYQESSFLGWRVAFCRNGRHFTRYFSDKLYGNKEESLRAAVEMRDAMRLLLERQSNDAEAVFQLFERLKPQSIGGARKTPESKKGGRQKRS